ncbi:hypothetical protein HYV82_02695 [Candidatus Woesearchaeota archaeon]|nr:hypothetical protein [Candidatus Woesearchaeota archaeon]
MGLFGKGKGKSGQAVQPAPMPMPSPLMPDASQGVPTEEVLRLRQQGLSNSQIVESLQRSGFKTHQIFDALNQAELGRSGEAIQGAPFFDQQPSQGVQFQEPQLEQQDAGYDYGAAPSAPGYDEKVEEVVEAIIEEKWNELLKDINRIVEWKSAMDANMKALEQRQGDLKQSFDNLQKALLAKIGEYDSNITSVGSELKALEKVFQKLLPAFTENVNELSRAVRDIKKK